MANGFDVSYMCAQLHPTLCHPHGLLSARLLCPLDSPGKNTGMGNCLLHQEIYRSSPGMEPMFLASPALAGRFFTAAPPGVKAPAHERWKGGTDRHISQPMTHDFDVSCV